MIFGVLITDKLLRQKKQLLYLNITMMITSPFTIVILSQKHVEYLSLTTLAISIVLLSKEEFLISLIMFFISHSLY